MSILKLHYFTKELFFSSNIFIYYKFYLQLHFYFIIEIKKHSNGECFYPNGRHFDHKKM